MRKDCLCRPKLNIIRHSNNKEKTVKPKELRGIKPINKAKVNDKRIQVFVDNEFNLWYKDNSLLIVENENNELIKKREKNWYKITGLYERKDLFILDIIREISHIAQEIHKDSSKVLIENTYEEIIGIYLEYFHKKDKIKAIQSLCQI